MKFYCGECFEEEGNCPAWCGERQRQETEMPLRSANSLGVLHATPCDCVACAVVKVKLGGPP